MESYEENNPSEFSLSEILKKIKLFDNRLNKNDIKFLYHGSYNVYSLKEDLIIKVPSKVLIDMFGVEIMIKEVDKLNFLRNKLDTTIPQPIFSSDDPDNSYYIYRKVPGISLSRIINEIPKNRIIHLGNQIGVIASNLHLLLKKFPNIVTDLNFDLTYDNYIESINKLYINSREKIFPLLKIKEKMWIENLFETFFEFEKKIKFSLVTTHNDFDTSNILVNPENDYDVSGIIDFEEFGLGDPAVDLLFQEEGKVFHQAVLSTYNGSKKDKLQLRMDFHKKKACLFYILTGLEHNLPKMVSHGKHMLKMRMQGYSY